MAPQFLTKICCLLLLGFRCADPNARSFYTYLLHSDLSHTVTAHALTWISDSLLALSDPPMPLVFLAQSSLTEQLNLKIIGLSSSLTAGEVAVSVCRGGCLSSGVFFFPIEGVALLICALLHMWIPSFSIKDPPGLLRASSPAVCLELNLTGTCCFCWSAPSGAIPAEFKLFWGWLVPKHSGWRRSYSLELRGVIPHHVPCSSLLFFPW